MKTMTAQQALDRQAKQAKLRETSLKRYQERKREINRLNRK